MDNTNTMYLSFIPNSDLEGQFKSLDMHLHNTFESAIDVSMQAMFNNEIAFANNHHIPVNEGVFLNQIRYLDLGEKPVFKFKARIKTEDDQKTIEVEQTIHIKIASFHKRYRSVPWFKIKVYVYEVLGLNDFLNQNSKSNKDDFAILAEKGIGHLASPEKNEIIKIAHFVDHIDLHIEKLERNKKLSNREILKIQVSAFTKYLDQALQHHQLVVYAIHGVGDGVLKKRVHEILDNHPHIAFYKNEYHPKYGYGATEIHFK
jgi:Smr domain